MRRLFILGTIVVGLLVAFGVTGEGGFQTARRAEAVETTTTWMYPTSGGILVSAGQPAEGNGIFQPAACTNCIITRIEPDLVYQNDSSHPDGVTANYNNNNSLDGAWLHHMVILNACSNPLTQIFASGNERSIWQAPTGYGYSWTCNLGWHVNYHIHNNGTADRRVALKLVVTYRTGETLTQTTPINLSISTASDAEYEIPVDYSDTHTLATASGGIASDWTSNIQGKIVAMGGHVHDYGISVSAYNNRLGDYICTSTGGYGDTSRYRPTGGPGTPGHPAAGNALTLNQSYHEAAGTPDDRYHIQAMTPCPTLTSAQSILCVGDVLRLHTQYNNTSGFPVFDAMGIMAGSVDTGLPDSNSNGTIDACEDNDGDGPRNSADNCPDWANPLQDMPLWTVPSGDTDCDGYHPTTLFGARAPESSIGTVATQHCAATQFGFDEPLPDAWPPDINDNQLVNGSDILAYNSSFGSSAPGPPYTARLDLNASGLINGADILQFNPFFGKRCKPLPP
jgi:hypothetical protein